MEKTSDKFNQLHGKISEVEKEDLEDLKKAVDGARESCRQNPSEAKSRKLKKSERGFEKRVQDLWDKYFVNDRVFKNRLEILEYLQDLGYSVQKSKVYNDCNAGILRMQPDKTILESAVQDYIRHPESGLFKAAELGKKKEAEDLTLEKLRVELHNQTLKGEDLQFELDKKRGKYLPRDDFEMELASRAAVLDSGIRHGVTVKAAEMILLVGGDQEKRADFLKTFQLILDEQLNRFSSTQTFQVMFLKEMEKDEPDAA